MGSVSLLAASVVVALLGFGWVNAIKDGIFDIFSFLRSDDTEEVMDDRMDELERDDAEHGNSTMDEEASVDADISVDPEFDSELNELDAELDALLNEADSELDALEGEL